MLKRKGEFQVKLVPHRIMSASRAVFSGWPVISQLGIAGNPGQQSPIPSGEPLSPM